MVQGRGVEAQEKGGRILGELCHRGTDGGEGRGRRNRRLCEVVEEKVGGRWGCSGKH